MSEQPVTSTPEGTFNVDLRGVHYDFLKDRVPAWFNQASVQRQQELASHEMELPSWYLTATVQQRAALADSHVRYRETLNQVENRLGNINDVLAFAEPLLKQAIKQRFDLDLDVNNVFFARKYGFKDRDDLFGAFVFDQQDDPALRYEYRTVSLLEAALANFEPDEEQAGPCSDCRLITTVSAAYGADVGPALRVFTAGAVPIAAHDFARMCRTLDLGNMYQQHINAVVQPSDESQRTAVHNQLQEHQRQRLALSAEIASRRPEWGISADAYRMVQQLITDPSRATLDGKTVTVAALQVFGSVLVGPLLIGPDRKDSDRVERLVVFIPNDPQQPLKEYASSAAFMAELRDRLHSASYRRFFSRFVPQREQGNFFQRFNTLYKPANGNGTAGDYPLGSRLRLPLDEVGINGNLWAQLRDAQVRKILADARAVAVPTGDEDSKAREERLESYLDAVVSVFNLAAFVVPGLGPIMLAVGAAQMCTEVYEGIEAYEQGDVKTMWAHFSSVALNAAMLGTGARVLPEIKLSSSVDNLKPVTLPTGKQVLWNPDLAPYKVPVKLPIDAKPDALGLYSHNGRTVWAHEGDYYHVRQEADTFQYRIQHPSRPGAYEPQLEHNHAGAWRHEVEEPLTWDKPTLMRRLGLEQRGLGSETLEQARTASGVEEDTLRQTFVEHAPLPLLLEDTLQHFKAHQALSTFVEQMHSSDPAAYAKAEPALQLNMMRRSGMLPVDAALRVLDGNNRILWQDDASATASRRVVVVSESQMARGGLLEQVLSTLQSVDPTLKEIPGSTEDSLAVRAGKLREHIANLVDTFKGQLVEERYKALNASDDPDVGQVLATYTRLPASMAAELIKSLTDEQLQAFRNSALLPEAQREQARWFEQEIRVSRAYEGLQLDTLANIDSQRLALRTLGTLPGWPLGTRVELRQYSAQGKLLDAIGSADSTTRKILVLKDNGLFEAPVPRDFYAAAFELLSVAERQGLGLTDAMQLKAAIVQSPLPRAPLRSVLLDNPVRKPSVEAGLGLLGGGRGFRKLVAGVFSPSEASINARVRTLYPDLSDEAVTAFIQSLGQDVKSGLKLREAEFETLKRELNVWVHANTAQSSSGALDPFARAPSIARQIISHWRRVDKGPMQLRMGGDAFELPVLSADFSHIETLELFAVRHSANIDAFLKKFTQLKGLMINRCGLTELPAAIGEMNNLTSLNLTGNSIRLSPRSARMLSTLGNLKELYLTNNPLGMAPDFSAMPRLRSLNLRNTQLEQWPTGLSADTGLTLVDLSHNLLREVPQQRLNPPIERLDATARLNNVTLLEGNRFPADYWQQFDNYWRRLNQALPELAKSAREGAFDSGNPRLEKIRRMYPDKRMHEARELIWGLGEGADAELARLELEFDTLQRQLSAWTFSGGGERQRYLRAGQRQANADWLDDRALAQQRIRACWRRDTPQMLNNDGQPIGLELDLGDLRLPSLPDLDVDFSHVGSLKLNNMNLSTSPEGFLTRYRHLRWLDLSNNQLRELPPAIGEMNGLTRLFLQNNQIRLTPETAQILSQRVTLRALWLQSNTLGIAPDFSLITDMRSLVLSNAGIDAWPAGLAAQPNLDQIDLRNNTITSVPAAVIAPPDAQLAQTARVNNVTSVSGNPLTADTLQQVRQYRLRLEQAGLATADNPNLLVATALHPRAAIVPAGGAQQPFLRWTQGLSADEVSAKRAQWLALRGQEGADGIFWQLDKLETTTGDHADQQARVWEVIEAISENTVESERLRQEIFELGAEAKCCDRAAFIFTNMEVAVMVSKARAVAGDQGQGAQLQTLAKGLFRLDEVDRIASADIARSEAIVNDPTVSVDDRLPHIQRLSEEVEIRLVYRVGLKERLQLPGPPQQMRFADLAKVTQAMLDAAYEHILTLDSSPKEFRALLSREFWQDYVTSKYRAKFEAQSQPYQERLADLTARFEAQELAKTLYKQQADELQARLAIEEGTLVDVLSREEIAQILLPREPLEVLVEPGKGSPRGLQLAQARAIEFNGNPYFVASLPDAEGEHYLLWVQAPDNPFALASSGVVAKPNADGVWKRPRTPGGMRPAVSDDEFEDAPESMPMAPYTADELSFMRREVHFTAAPNRVGSYNRANNGKYPLRDYQGRPIRIRKLQRNVDLAESGTRYTSDQVKPYIKFAAYEEVGARYEEKLQWRTFTAQDLKVPQESSLIGQSMVAANRRIAKGEILGVYGGTVLPTGIFGPSGQTYTMLVSELPILGGMQLGRELVHLSGDNILSRINTNFEYGADGKPLRQALEGYNVEAVPFSIEADMWLGMGPEATLKSKKFTLTAVFATEDIAAGTELRMDYQYTEGMIKTLFA
ncbi:dermonecrotic toxin domain-containing protein [Pseudomonas kitaguniensis]|uniref:dermonecrotic toxin domain-containing protein n=1 Tax=Pseudomonas kitaguniensis TaxID=2607908 RepID=UPI003D070F54